MKSIAGYVGMINMSNLRHTCIHGTKSLLPQTSIRYTWYMAFVDTQYYLKKSGQRF